MPKATVNVNETERHELTTCPGAFVELKRMSYSQYLKRRDMISGMKLKGEGKSAEAIMEMANEKVARYEFQECIVDHNLEDENGANLDFRSARAFTMLDPRIGDEISTLIENMNAFKTEDEEAEVELGNESEPQ